MLKVAIWQHTLKLGVFTKLMVELRRRLLSCYVVLALWLLSCYVVLAL